MSKKIVTCFPLTEANAEQIQRAAGDRFEVVVSSQEEIASNLLEADIFCGHAKVPVDWPAVVERGRLKWIQSSAAGLDHCLTPSVIQSQSIAVSGCSGLFSDQVAEQSMALLMALIRRLHVFFRAQVKREFIRRPTDNLHGKRIGIVGFGGNGQRIARTLAPMTQRIVATDCFPQACQELVDEGVVQNVLPANELEAMLPEIDILIVTLPLSATNEQRISDEQFALMKGGSYLINVGRGSVVDTESMIRNLQSGHLAGAGIDVVDPEPLPMDSPLWQLDNVVISPHVGAQSPLRVPVTVDLFCENLARFESGQPLLNQVDKELGFPRPEFRISFSDFSGMQI